MRAWPKLNLQEQRHKGEYQVLPGGYSSLSGGSPRAGPLKSDAVPKFSIFKEPFRFRCRNALIWGRNSGADQRVASLMHAKKTDTLPHQNSDKSVLAEHTPPRSDRVWVCWLVCVFAFSCSFAWACANVLA